MPYANRPEPEFLQLQRAFAAHIRSPQASPLPRGVAAERMAIYAELFYNNIESFLADSFPVLRRTIEQARWRAMVRDFYGRHACLTPLFTRLGEEFLDYLRRERGQVAGDPPYLAELAHYEWVELELTLCEAEPLPLEGPCGDLAQCRVRLSPLARPLRYSYPVHRIGPGYQLASGEQTPVHLLVYRDPEERVIYLEIDLWTHTFLSVLQAVGEAQVGELLRTLADRADRRRRDEFIAMGREVLAMLYRRGVIASAASSVQTAPVPLRHAAKES
jgi:hypothetical protein